MPAFCDPHFFVYGRNLIQSFLYMDRILEFDHIQENKDEILFVYGKIRILTRLSTKISQSDFQPMSKSCQTQRGLHF